MNQRFYDQDVLLKESIQLASQLPKDAQAVVVKGFNWIATHQFQADTRLGDLKSLGTEVVLPLYKSKSKRRLYDAMPAFHMAINYLRVLRPEERHQVADRLITFNRLVVDYIEKCTFTAFLPDHHRLNKISETFLPMEKERAQDYLLSVRQTLLTLNLPQSNITERTPYISGGTSIHLGEF
ncbi:hypothetical protein [Vampirovibrio chlorellavorus]|uniref:hypothetical protein n=1 Tax=Vampirovibrio chlorellavorus TaxID=758823 RepID=UPI0026EB3D4C|nr:hypothetical protein [Vampirovibrio chlorellavorus]